MQEELETIQELHKSGKLDRRLVWRMVILAMITTFTFCILFYDIFFLDLDFLPSVGFALLGFLIAYYIFMRINKVYWDDEKQIVAMGRFDLITVILLIVFIIYRTMIDKYFEGHYSNAIEATGYSLATLFGGMIGRFIGTIYAIDKSHKEKK